MGPVQGDEAREGGGREGEGEKGMLRGVIENFFPLKIYFFFFFLFFSPRRFERAIFLGKLLNNCQKFHA